MAADAIAVLDAIGVERAHVMGLSMGGMIVQTMAIEHPDRLLSMTSVMSRTGEPEYGESTPEAFALLTAPPATDRESYVAGEHRRPARVGQPRVRRRGQMAPHRGARIRPLIRSVGTRPSVHGDRRFTTTRPRVCEQ